MANPSKFLFDHDFRNPQPVRHDPAAVAEAEQHGYRRGLAEGRRQAEAEIAARLAQAVNRLADTAGLLLHENDGRAAEAETEAMEFAVALANKLAGEALRRQPLAAIAEAARNAFQHLRGVPHLVVRVDEALVERVEPVIQRIARESGYEGRLVILGEPDIAPGDARLEWADGGVVRDGAKLRETAAQIVAASFPSVPSSP